jgi:hypothetical protein
MAMSRSSAAKKEYNKPRLKAQIDRALSEFLNAGHEVERLPAVVAPEPPPPAPNETLFAAGKRQGLSVTSVIDDLQHGSEHGEGDHKGGA